MKCVILCVSLMILEKTRTVACGGARARELSAKNLNHNITKVVRNFWSTFKLYMSLLLCEMWKEGASIHHIPL